jgi:hypothetical protein
MACVHVSWHVFFTLLARFFNFVKATIPRNLYNCTLQSVVCQSPIKIIHACFSTKTQAPKFHQHSLNYFFCTKVK